MIDFIIDMIGFFLCGKGTEKREQIKAIIILLLLFIALIVIVVSIYSSI